MVRVRSRGRAGQAGQGADDDLSICHLHRGAPFASSTGGEWELAIIWARVAMPNFQRPGLSGACLAVVVKGAVDRAGTGRKVDDDTYGCRTDVYLGKRGSE